MIINKDGMSFIRLGKSKKRPIRHQKGTDSMVHSLASIDYLKIEKGNMIYFEKNGFDETTVHI